MLLVNLTRMAASRKLPVLIRVYRRTHGEILQAAIEAAVVVSISASTP